MQVGTGASALPWEILDAGGLAVYRRYARLHLRLFPYLWSHAAELSRGGLPLVRPLGLAHPELGVHPPDTYLLGDALLVAPVVRRGERERAVAFPPGRWLDWWSGAEVSTEAGTRTVPAPLERLPLFLRAGALVPLLRPTIDTLAPTSEPERVDSYAADPGVLHVRTSPGPAARLALFDGGELSQELDGDELVLRYRGGSELNAGARFEVLGWRGGTSRVLLDGELVEPAPALDERGRLVLDVPAGEHVLRVAAD